MLAKSLIWPASSHTRSPALVSVRDLLRAVTIGPGVAEEDVTFGWHDRFTEYTRRLVLQQVMSRHLKCRASQKLSALPLRPNR
jgi:hypothetical protein